MEQRQENHTPENHTDPHNSETMSLPDRTLLLSLLSMLAGSVITVSMKDGTTNRGTIYCLLEDHSSFLLQPSSENQSSSIHQAHIVIYLDDIKCVEGGLLSLYRSDTDDTDDTVQSESSNCQETTGADTEEKKRCTTPTCKSEMVIELDSRSQSSASMSFEESVIAEIYRLRIDVPKKYCRTYRRDGYYRHPLENGTGYYRWVRPHHQRHNRQNQSYSNAYRPYRGYQGNNRFNAPYTVAYRPGSGYYVEYPPNQPPAYIIPVANAATALTNPTYAAATALTNPPYAAAPYPVMVPNMAPQVFYPMVPAVYPYGGGVNYSFPMPYTPMMVNQSGVPMAVFPAPFYPYQGAPTQH